MKRVFVIVYVLLLLAMVGVLVYSLNLKPEVLTLNPQMQWRTGWGVTQQTDDWEKQPLDNGGMRFVVNESGRAAGFVSLVFLKIDVKQTPFLEMSYRATNINSPKANMPLLSLWKGGKGSVGWISYKEIKVDGQEHILRVDLRKKMPWSKKNPSVSGRLNFRFYAEKDVPGTFDLLGLKLEIDASELDDDHQAVPVKVHVTDENSQPVVGATVVLDPHLIDCSEPVLTDANGVAVVKTLKHTITGTRRALLVKAPGMSPVLCRGLSKVEGQTAMDVQLYPIQSVGGQVVDEQGKPVAGAVGRLENRIVSRRFDTKAPYYLNTQYVRTDAHGKWNTTTMLRQGKMSLVLQWLTPNDYVLGDGVSQLDDQMSSSQFFAGEYKTVLKRGIDVKGVVYDQNDKPLKDALLSYGNRAFRKGKYYSTQTNGKGEYRFPHVPQGQLILTVTAKKHAPAILKIQAVDSIKPLDFHLKEPAAFYFKVVDKDDKPVSDVRISPSTWQGFRTLKHAVKTDKKGLATWYGPRDSVKFSASGGGKNRVSQLAFLPSKNKNDVHVIRVFEPLHVYAVVTDKKTGMPIPAFRVLEGHLRQVDETPYFYPYFKGKHFGQDGKLGQWDRAFKIYSPYYKLKIQADGYAPMISKPIAHEAGQVDLYFELEKADDTVGKIVDQQKKPIGGALVYVCESMQIPFVINGMVQHNARQNVLTTNMAGQFQTAHQSEQVNLVVLDDYGYAQVTIKQLRENQGTITLSPWCVITGKLLIGDQPGRGTAISTGLHNVKIGKIMFASNTITDQDGYFKMDRIPSGPMSVGRQIKQGSTVAVGVNPVKFELKPGQIIDVQIGGTGRPVVGQFAWHNKTFKKSLAFGHRQLRSINPYLARYEKQMPKGFGVMAFARRMAYLQSEKGQKMLAENLLSIDDIMEPLRYYNFEIADDGSFRVDDVQPGEYELTFSAQEPRSITQHQSEVIAKIEHKFLVPDLPAGAIYDATPADLGTLVLKQVEPKLKVGDPVGDFSLLELLPVETAKDFDLEHARRFNLSDFKGKVVLLHFWSSKSDHQVGNLTMLKRMWKKTKTDSRFVILGVCVDKLPATAAMFIQKNQMLWQHGFLGAQYRTYPAIKKMGSVYPPSTWLIDPDLKIIAKKLPSHQVLQMVQKTLDNMPVKVMKK